MKKMRMRKRRNGGWYSMGSGTSNTNDRDADDTGDDDTDDDDDETGDARIQRLPSEAARRRRQAREYKEKWQAAERKLAESDKGNTGSSADSIKTAIQVAAAITKAGIKGDRVEA